MEMTIEQKRALAMASARARAATVTKELVTPVEATSATPQDEGYLSGITQQMRQGASFGFADEVGAAGAGTGGALVAALRGRNPIDAFSNSYDRRLGELRGSSEKFYSDNPVASSAAQVAGGLSTVGGKAVNAIAQAPGLARTVARGAATGAAYGGLTGFGAGEGGFEDRAKNAGIGAGTGAVVGGAAPLVFAGARGAGRAIGRAIAPVNRVSPEAAALAQKATDEGIKINAAQLTNSPHLRVLDSVTRRIPFSGATSEMNAQQAAFNKAVARRIGVDADKITPEIYAAAKSRLGSEFERLSLNNKLPLSSDLMGKVSAVADDAAKFGTDDTARAVKSLIDEAVSKTERGVLPGKAYQALDSKMGQIMKAGGEKSHYVGQLRDAIRSAMDDAISPADQAAWKLARNQYRNLKTLTPLVSADSLEGNISPARLMGRLTATGSGKEAVASGRGGDLTDIAQIGQRFLKDAVPNSGTPERMLAYGALGGASWAEPMTGLGIAGSANLTRRVLNSDAYRRLLLSRAVNSYRPSTSQPVVDAFVNRLAPYGAPASVLAVTEALRKPD